MTQTMSNLSVNLRTLVERAIHNCPIERSRSSIVEKYLGGRNERVLIDFSSPNIAKPFHFGHLKSTILGNYLANLNSFLGNHVTKLNYVGDWGTQYGLLSLGLTEFGDNGLQLPEHKSPLRFLLDVYVKSNERGQSDANFYTAAKERFLELHKPKNSELLRQWQHIRDLSLNELKKSYSDLGVSFDIYDFESDYAEESLKLVECMRSKDFVATNNDGMTTAKVEKNNKWYDVPILKSDGTSLYITRDLAAAIRRKDKFKFDKMLYVVGADQERHFHYLKEILKQMGHDWHKQLIHVKMGKVLGMSSRSGNFVLLSDIIDLATDKYIESTENTATSRAQTRTEVLTIAKSLALSSVFVFDMRNRRTRNYEFQWDLVMSTGDRSGINLQTTNARLEGLFSRASKENLELATVDKIDLDALLCEEAVSLLAEIDRIEDALDESYVDMDPMPLVNHVLLLCKAINRALRSERMKIVGNDKTRAETSLTLFKLAQSQLKFIIKLIGLNPLDRT